MTSNPDDTSMQKAELPRGECSECELPDRYLDRTLQDTFHIQVCSHCKHDLNMLDGRYELVAKGRAKIEFALPESFFDPSRSLPYATRPNPRHESFAPVKLYLKKTLLEEAYRRYKDKNGLEAEVRRRRKESYSKAAIKTKGYLRHASDIAPKKKVRRLDPKLEQNAHKDYTPISTTDHQHTFEEEQNPQTLQWYKKCVCGLRVEIEKL